MPPVTILTSDEFLTLILARLRLAYPDHAWSVRTWDALFETLYEDLAAQADQWGMAPNFTFYRDPFHRDSLTFRDALMRARLHHRVTAPSVAGRCQVTLTEAQAQAILARSVVPEVFLDHLMRTHVGVAFDQERLAA
jgi:hypothetical protein